MRMIELSELVRKYMKQGYCVSFSFSPDSQFIKCHVRSNEYYDYPHYPTLTCTIPLGDINRDIVEQEIEQLTYDITLVDTLRYVDFH